jgi:epoxyqueuosine reductase
VMTQGLTDIPISDRQLTERLKRHLGEASHGAALVGVAPVERFEGAPRGHHPCDFVPDARSVVVIALPIVSGLMNWHEYLEKSEIIKDVDSYADKDGKQQTWSPRTVIRKHIERRCCYEVINDQLQSLSMYGAIFLEQAGHRATYLPATYGQTLSWPGNYQWDFPKPPRGFAPFSHRHAAVAAGLGVLGLNNLLLTPQYGPRQRLVSIITCAPLAPDPLVVEPVCLGEKCSLCSRRCPAHAFGDLYEVEIAGRKTTLRKVDIEACRGYYKNSTWGSQCGRECLTSCPLRQRNSPTLMEGEIP